MEEIAGFFGGSFVGALVDLLMGLEFVGMGLDIDHNVVDYLLEIQLLLIKSSYLQIGNRSNSSLSLYRIDSFRFWLLALSFKN